MAEGQARRLRTQAEAAPRPQPPVQQDILPDWAQIQGKCESTCPGFCRSSPECACEGRKTPRRVDGRHAHRRTESEVVVGGQKSRDARFCGRGRHGGDICIGAVWSKGADQMRAICHRRRVSRSAPWRGSVRTLLGGAHIEIGVGHRGTRIGEAAHLGPTRRLRRVVDVRHDEMLLLRRSTRPRMDWSRMSLRALLHTVVMFRQKLSRAKGVGECHAPRPSRSLVLVDPGP